MSICRGNEVSKGFATIEDLRRAHVGKSPPCAGRRDQDLHRDLRRYASRASTIATDTLDKDLRRDVGLAFASSLAPSAWTAVAA